MSLYGASSPGATTRRHAVGWALALGMGLWSCAAQAQERLPPLDAQSIHERLEQQEAEIRRLREQIERDRAAAATNPSPAAPTYPASLSNEFDTVSRRLDALEQDSAKAKAEKDKDKKPDDGWVDLSNEKWTVKLGGHVQLDYINWACAAPSIPNTQDYFEFRRLRLVADGTGYGQYDFRLQMTLEPETVGESGGQATSPDVKDAYLSVNELPILGRWRIGNFFVPFGLEQVTNDTNNVFLERSIPTQGVFCADREVGMAFYNCTEDKNITWSSGIFFDSISDTLKERIDDNQGCRISGRLTYVPYYDEPSNGRYVVHTGVGILHTIDQDHAARFRARPQIHEGPRLIDSGVIAADQYTTGNLEAAVVWGRTTLQSEAYLCSIDRNFADPVVINGMYAHLSYFLTGENRIFERFGQHGAQFGRNQPFSNYFAVPGCRSWGAWEAKARWSHLDLNSLDRGQYNDLTVGFNWYWSDRVRVMFDWIHPITSSDVVVGAVPIGATDSDILGIRYDFNW